MLGSELGSIGELAGIAGCIYSFVSMQRIWQTFKNFGIKAIPVLQMRESLVKESELDLNFIVLIVSSCLIATFGLLVNSAAVIIGAMIIAPLMLPIRGLSFGLLEGDGEILTNSVFSIAVGTTIAIVCSGFVGSIVGLPEFGSEVLARTQPNLVDLMVALVAGGISGYSKIRSSLSDAVPGTAIAVALMPPLCVVGLTLSQGLWSSSGGAFLLFITNLLGINLACTIVYVLGGYTQGSPLRRSLSWGVSLFLIGLLAIPLGFSLVDLIDQAKVNNSIRSILTSRPLLNREDIELVDTQIDPRAASVVLVVRAVGPIEPEEVATVEQVLETELKKPFKVVFDVTESRKVESSLAR